MAERPLSESITDAPPLQTAAMFQSSDGERRLVQARGYMYGPQARGDFVDLISGRRLRVPLDGSWTFEKLPPKKASALAGMTFVPSPDGGDLWAVERERSAILRVLIKLHAEHELAVESEIAVRLDGSRRTRKWTSGALERLATSIDLAEQAGATIEDAIGYHVLSEAERAYEPNGRWRRPPPNSPEWRKWCREIRQLDASKALERSGWAAVIPKISAAIDAEEKALGELRPDPPPSQGVLSFDGNTPAPPLRQPARPSPSAPAKTPEAAQDALF